MGGGGRGRDESRRPQGTWQRRHHQIGELQGVQPLTPTLTLTLPKARWIPNGAVRVLHGRDMCQATTEITPHPANLLDAPSRDDEPLLQCSSPVLGLTPFNPGVPLNSSIPSSSELNPVSRTSLHMSSQGSLDGHFPTSHNPLLRPSARKL